ncbi:MAG: DinB family protein [Dehalococcoidia bacterium]
MDAVTHARTLIAYTGWADRRILAVAGGLDEPRLDEQLHPTQPAIRDVLTHYVGTYLFWLANWDHAPFDDLPSGQPFAAVTDLFAGAHDNLGAFGRSLADTDWDRAEAWWKRYGFDQTAPLGQTLVQVINHATQHRSEVAMMLTAFGSSPGDLDYLVFLRELAEGRVSIE